MPLPQIERNTTLPHPDADTSIGAVIEGPEIALSRSHSLKMSFLSHRSKHGNASGKINPADLVKVEDAGLYDNIQYADGTKEKRSMETLEHEAEKKSVVVDAPETDSDGEVPPFQGRDDQGYKDGGRKKGILRQKILHKS